jgi:uncharacterized protein
MRVIKQQPSGNTSHGSEHKNICCLSIRGIGYHSLDDRISICSMRFEMTSDDDVNLQSGMSAFESKHFTQAMNFLLPFAERGLGDAQHRVAIMLQNGLGMVRNEFQALKWMKKAAEQGHAVAQHGLGFMYMQGDCVAKNGEKAVFWFTQAAEQGLAGSQTTLAMMYENGDGIEKDVAKAQAWYKKAGF